MKAYIVVSNVEFTTICIAKDAAVAVKKAEKISMEKYGFIVDGLEAHEIKDYLSSETNGIEISIL